MQKIHQGDLIAEPGVSYDFTEITGHLDCRKANAETQFPALTTIGGAAYFSGWNGSAPALTTIGGRADFEGWTGSATALTTIGGSAYFLGWTGSAPALTTIGGSAYFEGWTGSAPALTTIGGSAYFLGWKHRRDDIVIGNGNPDTIRESLANSGLVLIDGILARIVSKRGPVMRVIIVGQTRVSYILESDGQFAHGETLAEARQDLLVKIGNRDTTPYKSWTLDTVATLDEMVVAYRVITGACGTGTRHFLASRNFPSKATVARAIRETSGAYGSETFKNFFTT